MLKGDGGGLGYNEMTGENFAAIAREETRNGGEFESALSVSFSILVFARPA